MPVAFPAAVLVKARAEVRSFLFDFSTFPEVQAGDTLASVAAPSVSGLVLGTPAITGAAVSEAGVTVPSGQGAWMTISSGDAGTDYSVEVRATTTAARVLVVRGILAVR